MRVEGPCRLHPLKPHLLDLLRKLRASGVHPAEKPHHASHVGLHVAKLALSRLLELLACYFLTGALALFLEQRAGQIAPQGWEFYAITATLFITLAFPGFIYRYLLRHRD